MCVRHLIVHQRRHHSQNCLRTDELHRSAIVTLYRQCQCYNTGLWIEAAITSVSSYIEWVGNVILILWRRQKTGTSSRQQIPLFGPARHYTHYGTGWYYKFAASAPEEKSYRPRFITIIIIRLHHIPSMHAPLPWCIWRAVWRGIITLYSPTYTRTFLLTFMC